jgi:hypothetical protein
MIESAGTPATVLITEPFQGLIASGAVKLGMPGYHALVIPHPIWGKGPDELRELAVAIAESALAQLTGG